MKHKSEYYDVQDRMTLSSTVTNGVYSSPEGGTIGHGVAYDTLERGRLAVRAVARAHVGARHCVPAYNQFQHK